MLNEVKRMQKIAGLLRENEEATDWKGEFGLSLKDYVYVILDGGRTQPGEIVGFDDLEGVTVKLDNGKTTTVSPYSIEKPEDDDSGDGEHYGDEEDDKSYYQSRGWKSSMEEEQDPSEKIDKLVGLEEGSESDFEKFMRAMGDLYGLSTRGFLKPEEWKPIFDSYTKIYARVQDMGVEHFKNDK
jgi:hypothetical protein